MAGYDRRDILKLGLGSAILAAMPRIAEAAPLVRVDDPELASVIDPTARARTIFEGGKWCEGTCYVPALAGLVFSDVKSNRLWLVKDDGSREPYRDPSNNSNGNVLDAEGRLVTCEHRTRRVVRQEKDGTLTTLAETFEGKRLNSPNDAVLAPDGAIWFTDPTYGITQPAEGILAEPEQTARRVYRIDPSGRLEAKSDAFDQPNGIGFSPDGRVLYVSETGGGANPEGARGIHAFDVSAEGNLSGKRIFAAYDSGVPDGLAVDVEGRVYAASGDGVRIYGSDGRMLGRIATAKTVGNLAFGGPDGRRLFIAATDVIQVIDMKVAGVEWLGRK
ncbi:SMP-30/gluconolactonase/LRE family protein [Aureimonas psammosilenae]|uniref:SMP-30/gluconolactonase/LRE family protein n=1 Tax=Aureimonas psammosilenae TaxID=2495496 RepID=UPI001F377A4D|nr:SMP-30/gluconolactonase/LRE family protein [Aureimonas psammosilenae]